MSGTNWVKRGSLLGTGSAIKINTGFKPVKVELYNSDVPISAVKYESMEGAYAAKSVAAGTNTFTDSICTLEDDGFTVGTDAINAAGELLHWVAWQAHND